MFSPNFRFLLTERLPEAARMELNGSKAPISL
jgi:hypothetical protein